MTDYTGIAAQAAVNNNIPVPLFLSQIQSESGFDPSAYNPGSGATGIAQILPSTAAQPGYGITPVNPNDPVASLNFAAQYDAAQFARTGSYTGMLGAYGTNNAGTTSIAQQLDSGSFFGNLWQDFNNFTDPSQNPGAFGLQGPPAPSVIPQDQGGTASNSSPVEFLQGSFIKLGVFILAGILVLGGIYALATGRHVE